MLEGNKIREEIDKRIISKEVKSGISEQGESSIDQL